MKKRGFTLIELLAVIIILAIIALIAIPAVTNIIEDAKKGAAKTSALGFIEAVENQVSINDLTSSNQIFDNVYDTDTLQSTYEVTVKGTKPSTGSWVKIENGEVSCYSLKEDNYVVSKDCTSLTETTEKTDTIVDKPSNSGLPTSVSFADDSWDTISQIVKAGVASSYYSVGDTKTITLAAHTNDCSSYTGYGATYACVSSEESEKEVTVRISNMSACTNGETSQTACGFVVEFVDIIEKHNMNPADATNTSGTNVGGWRDSALRTYLNSTLLSALPSDLQSVIADTYVVSGHGSSDTENITSTDKLYLLSTHEVWIDGTSSLVSKYDTSYSETRQLDYYANLGVTTNNRSGAIKNYNGTATEWWIRSAYSSNTEAFLPVDIDGNWASGNAHATSGVSAAFRIA